MGRTEGAEVREILVREFHEDNSIFRHLQCLYLSSKSFEVLSLVLGLKVGIVNGKSSEIESRPFGNG